MTSLNTISGAANSERASNSVAAGKTADCHVIGEDSPPLPHRFGSHRTLVGPQADADKALGQLSIGLFSDQFVGQIAAPEINARHLEELTRGLTEQLDQGLGPGPVARFGGNAQQKLLEALIGPGSKTVLRGRDRTVTRNAECSGDNGGIVFVDSQVLESIGKLPVISI